MIFPPVKIRWLRPGLIRRTWVPEASTLTPRPPQPPEMKFALFYIYENEIFYPIDEIIFHVVQASG
jgi:hypothetical protein